MAQKIKPQIEIQIDYANRRAFYRLNGDVYYTAEDVGKRVEGVKDVGIIWKGVFSFSEYMARRGAESKILKILNGLNEDGKNGR